MSVFSQAINNVRDMKNHDGKEEFVKKIGKTVKGSAIGLVGGLMVGWYTKKNLYVSGILGTLVGGGIGYVVTKLN